MKKRIASSITIAVVAVLSAIAVRPRPTVDGVMADFHRADGRAEDMLMDPLIRHADLVKERVIQDIRNPEMDKRRYAIGFLGNEKITDALEAICQMDQSRGRQLARNLTDRGGYLGRVARGLLDGSHKINVRTKTDAWMGRHD